MSDVDVTAGQLSKGWTGEPIEDLQRLLNRYVAPALEINGVFDDVTEAAVKDVQRRFGYEPDGVVDMAFMVLLEAEAPEFGEGIQGVIDAHGQGRRAFDDGEYDVALRHFLEALADSENVLYENPVMSFNIMQCYAKLGNSAQATEWAKYFIENPVDDNTQAIGYALWVYYRASQGMDASSDSPF